jgi:hypothetical protein
MLTASRVQINLGSEELVDKEETARMRRIRRYEMRGFGDDILVLTDL